jgi:hypothetical protein
MTIIQARSKYSDISGSFKLYYVLGVGAFVCILSFAIYANFIIPLTMAACTIVIYLILSRKPQIIDIETVEDGFMFDKNAYMWSDCVSWAVVTIGTTSEFIIETTKLDSRFLYFYIENTTPQINQLLAELGNKITYDDQMPNKNIVHNILHRLGLQ